MRIEFTVLGKPKAQPRSKARWRPGMEHASIYTPGTAEEWKGWCYLAAKEHVPEKPLGGPLAVSVNFWFARPLAHFGTGRNEGKLKVTAPGWHISTPDLDNLVKAVLDACTQVGFWTDDRVVASLQMEKWWSATAGMTIIITDEMPQLTPEMHDLVSP